MDIDILKRFNRNYTTADLESIMSPRLKIDNVIRCDYEELFELRMAKVFNLYESNERRLKLKHDSNLVVSKAEIKLKKKDEFEVEFEERFYIENGINYMGKIILKDTRNFIRVPGEGTYDPGSSDPYLNSQSYVVITGCYCAALYCMRRGNKESIEKIFSVFVHNKAFDNHKSLMEYMEYQIKSVVIEKSQAKDYGTWLQQKHFEESDLLKKENENLLTYLYILGNESYPKSKIFPCKKYITSLEKNRPESANDIFIEFVRNYGDDIYLIPDTEKLKRIVFKSITYIDHDDRELIDLRFLKRNLDKLKNDYNENMKKVIEGRDEHNEINQKDIKMDEVVTPYHGCCSF